MLMLRAIIKKLSVMDCHTNAISNCLNYNYDVGSLADFSLVYGGWSTFSKVMFKL